MKNLPYQYSVKNIFKNGNIYNISNNNMNPNIRQRLRNINKSASFKIYNSEINF